MNLEYRINESYDRLTANDREVLNRILRNKAQSAGMNSTETDLDVNNKIILTVGAREVEGFNGYQGTGFRITGTAKLIDEGEDYEMMKKQFSFLRKVLEIKVEEAKQLL